MYIYISVCMYMYMGPKTLLKSFCSGCWSPQVSPFSPPHRSRPDLLRLKFRHVLDTGV